MPRTKILLLAILLAFAAYVVYSAGTPPGGDGEQSRAAPPFSLKTPSGELRTLAELKGKVVLVDVWATWCGPCAMAIPVLQKLYEQHKDEGFEVFGVALENDKGQQIPGYVKEMGITYTVGLFADPNEVKAWVGPETGLPTMFLVDRKGIVRWSRSGFAPSEVSEIGRRVRDLLKE